MIGTRMTEGFGLGNQLFFYVTTRCTAIDRGVDFSILGSETMANNMHSDCGLYFMDLDYGKSATEADFPYLYQEKDDRLFIGNSAHDLTHGAYVTDADEDLMKVSDGTLLVGNMQAEKYYIKHREEIKEWFRVKPEYDTYEYSRDNLCIMHIRCSDYMDNPELFLRKRYWLRGMKHMRKINPKMEFMIITNDVKEVNKLLPNVPAYNFDLATDYAVIKNARYLLLSNSSFTYFPAFTSETVKYILAPKYWARHNVSNGYWASEQNIYSGWNYMDRRGRVFSADECRKELAEYKKTDKFLKHFNKRPEGAALTMARIKSTLRFKWYKLVHFGRSGMRKIRILLHGTAS